jgi:hypothetical protein
MLILSEKGNKLIEANALFIREIKDKEDQNKTAFYKVVGVTNNGRSETLTQFDTYDDAKGYIKGVYNANVN